MWTHLRALCMALLIGLPAVANAQTPVTAVSLADPDPPGWDAFGHVAWLTVDKSEIAPDWNNWYDVATFGVSVGKFVGPHLKFEFDVATSTDAEIYTEYTVRTPSLPNPIFVAQPNRFRMTTFAAGASYQFLENRWAHPVIGVGVETGRERRTVDEAIYSPFLPVTPAIPPGTSVTWRTRPFVSTGFKLYVAERAFIRSDVRTTLDSGGVSQVSWRTGIGFDF